MILHKFLLGQFLCLFVSALMAEDSHVFVIENKDITVSISLMGGRITEYSLNGENVLYTGLSDSMKYTEEVQGYFYPSAGRFDIGPEKVIPKRPGLFSGEWKLLKKSKNEISIISSKNKATGVQLQRIFKLANDGCLLECKQIITNVSSEVKKYCHWGRTFAKGNGICLIPLNPHSRYPEQFLMYGPNMGMLFNNLPMQNLKVENDVLAITGPPGYPKFAFDSPEGWIAYISTNNLLFVKTFPIYPDKIYGEMAGNNSSVWYFDTAVCEIEPIGPWEYIPPQKSVEFTEKWWLYSYEFPQDRNPNINKIVRIIKDLEK